jgi:hypothetical protein
VPKSYVARVLQRQGDECEHAAEEIASEQFKSRKPSHQRDSPNLDGVTENLAAASLDAEAGEAAPEAAPEAEAEAEQKEAAANLSMVRARARSWRAKNLWFRTSNPLSRFVSSQASRLSPRVLSERIAEIREKATAMANDPREEEEQWVLFNGFVVTKTEVPEV